MLSENEVLLHFCAKRSKECSRFVLKPSFWGACLSVHALSMLHLRNFFCLLPLWNCPYPPPPAYGCKCPCESWQTRLGRIMPWVRSYLESRNCRKIQHPGKYEYGLGIQEVGLLQIPDRTCLGAAWPKDYRTGCPQGITEKTVFAKGGCSTSNFKLLIGDLGPFQKVLGSGTMSNCC